MVQEHRRFAERQYRVQATRLAEAGLQRALARRTADAAFNSETWNVPAESFGGSQAGVVQIRVVTESAAGKQRYEATAQFPAGAVRRAQITKRFEVSAASTEGES
jgi:hypothetical protein